MIVTSDCIKIKEVCQTQFEIVFDEQFLAYSKKVRDQAALVDLDANRSHGIIVGISLCYGIYYFGDQESDN